MTLYEFNGLDEQEQIEAIWKDGVLQGKRNDESYDFWLYQINDFYIEMKCVKGTDNIIHLKTFRTTELLSPYLEQMTIKLS